MKKSIKSAQFAIAAVASIAAASSLADNENGFFSTEKSGIKIGERLMLNPSVSFSYSWDSNVDQNKDSGEKDSSSWNVSPRLGFTWGAESCTLSGSVYYNYSAHSGGRSSDDLNNSSFGENLSFSWSSQDGEDDGYWSFNLGQSYHRILQSDSMSSGDGLGYWRDRDQMTFNASISRQFNDRWHAGVNGSWYCIDYENDTAKYMPLYGWGRWTVGGNIGYVVSQWADVYVSASYNGYTQDNQRKNSYSKVQNESSESKGVTVHGGFSSRMTERISYDLSMGWSRYEQGDGDYTRDGFTYNGSLNWVLDDMQTWRMMLLLSADYHPSERDYAASTRSDRISWGISHSMVEGKLSATFDVAYRHETHDLSNYEYKDDNVDNDYLTFRLGTSYQLCRYMSVFASGEYQLGLSDDKETSDSYSYDYDRFRLNVGFSLMY